VVNFGDTSIKAEFTLTTYATEEKAQILDKGGYLESDLNEALEKAGGSDNEQIKKVEGDGVEMYSYFNAEKKELIVRITKVSRDQTVTAMF